MSQENYKLQFIELAQSVKALSFGQFELKSGRISPYFFNAGKFNTGESLWKMAECYAQKIINSNIKFDIIFGPAYKGIPLVSAVSVILSQKTGKEIPWAFNRKESKNHGEGGITVGSDIKGKVLIIDDVITAGTAVKETIKLLSNYDTEISGIIVALDRQEISPDSNKSSIKLIEDLYQVKTYSVIKLDDLIEFGEKDNNIDVGKLRDYRKKYTA